MERKSTFNSIADKYDKYRITYPKEMFQDIINYSHINCDSRIVEIGCGTGQATQGFIDLNYKNITCIEIGDKLVERMKWKYRDEPRVQVIHSSFEDWRGSDSMFDLAISGTAFHFIDPSIGYPKVARLLKNNKTTAFFWTIHVSSIDSIHEQVREQYRRLAPHLDDSLKPSPQEAIDIRVAIMKHTNLFQDIVVKNYSWNEAYTSERYISLLHTHSKHLLLPDDVRGELFSQIKDIIDRNGGFILKPQLVALFLGRLDSV